VQALQHAGPVHLRALVEGDGVVAADAPSAIWWKTSTMTATLMTLAVGNGVSAFTNTVSPGGEVPGRDAHGAAQRSRGLLDPRLQAGRGEGRARPS
jgi:hypothetical protein